MTMLVEVTEFTDPGCPWSWGAEPVVRWLQHGYGEHLCWRRVLGVQTDRAPGAEPVDDPDELQTRWLEISGDTGAPVPDRLQWAIGSSHPAARTVKAAERQGDEAARRALRALREATFVFGRPADTLPRIAAALAGVPGLDQHRLRADEGSHGVVVAADADYGEARRPDPAVILLNGSGPHPGAATHDGDHQRYAFPTLVFRGRRGVRLVPGWRPPGAYREAIEAVEPELAGVEIPRVQRQEALERWRSLTGPELEILCGSPDPPADAVEVQTATSTLWLHPDDAPLRLAGISRRPRRRSARSVAEVTA